MFLDRPIDEACDITGSSASLIGSFGDVQLAQKLIKYLDRLEILRLGICSV